MSAPAPAAGHSDGTSASASAAPVPVPTPTPPPPSFRPTYLNLLGASVLDDNVRVLSDFLYAHVQMPDVELEGKLGLLHHKKKLTRTHIDGVQGLVNVSAEKLDANFKAEVDALMFRHIHEDLLHRRYSDDVTKARAFNARPHWRFAHTRITDKFYTVGNDHIRVSYDEQGRVMESICKEKLAHIEFYNGRLWHDGRQTCIDIRVSASRERKVPVPTSACIQIRRKDRLSYRFDLWLIELTRVDLFNALTPEGDPAHPDRPTETTYEVEVEIKEMEFLRREAAKVRAGQPNEFVKIVASFLDQLRTLSQFAWPDHLPANLKAPPASASSAAGAVVPPPPVITPVQQPQQPVKRRRVEEDSSSDASKQEYGRAWS